MKGVYKNRPYYHAYGELRYGLAFIRKLRIVSGEISIHQFSRIASRLDLFGDGH